MEELIYVNTGKLSSEEIRAQKRFHLEYYIDAFSFRAVHFSSHSCIKGGYVLLVECLAK